MKRTIVCVLGVVAALGALVAAQAPVPVYKNPSAPVQERVRDLLARMTVEEKVAQLQSGWNMPASDAVSLPRLFEQGRLNEELAKTLAGNGLGTYVFLDEFKGAEESGDPAFGVRRRNLLQSWVLSHTRLGIPILFHGEALHGTCRPGGTSFPAPVGLGSTWDPDLVEQAFSLVAREVRASGNALVLGPVLDLSRDPRFGRVEEMYGEDPYLVSRIGVAAVRGLQGTRPGGVLDQEHVYATAKHFVHGQPENGTNGGPSDFSERTMRSVFLYPFEQVIAQARIEAVMPSYNETVGGIPSHANSWLLRDVLRNEWGFAGITVSDYTAIDQLASLHHVAADRAAAGALALRSGVDMELPMAAAYPTLVEAVRSGAVASKDLDEAVSRVLSAKFRAGLFETPLADEARATAVVGNRDHAGLARKVADESVVLLKNAGSLLPLDAARYKTIAVIGPNGRAMRLGGYSTRPPYYVSVAEGIQKRAGAGVKVVVAEGCRISEPGTPPYDNLTVAYQPPAEETDRRLLQEAIAAARNADLVVLALGGDEVVSRESLGAVGRGKPAYGDSDTLELPGRQGELAHAVSALGKPTVAVLLNGKAYAIEQLASEVPAILEGWYLGQETGNAVAGILFGDVNPSGHLPVTIARNVGQLPVYYYKTPAARRGYVFHDNSPLFPFGHGLSYTTFAIGKPALDRERIAPGESARATVTVTNTGSRAGDQVVQLYVHHVVSSVVQPVRLLRGFKRVHLEPGASVTVTFDVGPDQLSILDGRMRKVVEPGDVDVMIGDSSANTASARLLIR